jgi:hypothetical protein
VGSAHLIRHFSVLSGEELTNTAQEYLCKEIGQIFSDWLMMTDSYVI